jgi:di/tricarboxylate transporter
LGFLSLEKGLILLLVLFLFLGYTRINELRRRVPVELALIIGSALAISQVLSDSGAAQLIADAVMFVFGDWGVWGALIGVYLLTVLITELVTNNAAAAICFPIALATSQALDVSFWPFVMVVAYGASASFMTPYGYQTNLMVYSAGNYRFQDYLRLGGPVSLLYGVIVLGLVPVFFPF